MNLGGSYISGIPIMWTRDLHTRWVLAGFLLYFSFSWVGSPLANVKVAGHRQSYLQWASNPSRDSLKTYNTECREDRTDYLAMDVHNREWNRFWTNDLSKWWLGRAINGKQEELWRIPEKKIVDTDITQEIKKKLYEEI